MVASRRWICSCIFLLSLLGVSLARSTVPKGTRNLRKVFVRNDSLPRRALTGKEKYKEKGKDGESWTSPDGGTAQKEKEEEDSMFYDPKSSKETDKGHDKEEAMEEEMFYDNAKNHNKGVEKGQQESYPKSYDMKKETKNKVKGKSTNFKDKDNDKKGTGGQEDEYQEKQNTKESKTGTNHDKSSGGEKDEEPDDWSSEDYAGSQDDVGSSGHDSSNNHDTSNGQDTSSSPESQMQEDPSPLVFVESRFSLEFELDSDSSPLTGDFMEMEEVTIGYLEEYLELAFNEDSMIRFADIEIDVEARRTGTNPMIDLSASVAFEENSPVYPTSVQIGEKVSEALSNSNFETYAFALRANNNLGQNNAFLAIESVTVFIPNPMATMGGRVSSRNNDGGNQNYSAGVLALAAGAGMMTFAIGWYVLLRPKSETSKAANKYLGSRADDFTLDETCASSSIGGDDYHDRPCEEVDDSDQSVISSMTGGGFQASRQAKSVSRQAEPHAQSAKGESAEINNSVGKYPSAKKVPDVEQPCDSSTIPEGPAAMQNEQIESQLTILTNQVYEVGAPQVQLSNQDIQEYFENKYGKLNSRWTEDGTGVKDPPEINSTQSNSPEAMELPSQTNTPPNSRSEAQVPPLTEVPSQDVLDTSRSSRGDYSERTVSSGGKGFEEVPL